MSELAELLERFRRGSELVAMSMTGAAGLEVDFVPAPGKWSVRQIICHLADAEVVGYTRFRFVMAEDNPVIQWWDEEAWAKNLDYARRKPSQAIETFRRTRAENYELFSSLPPEAFARTGVHSKNGPMTLLDLLKLYAEHAESHVAQIRTVRAAYKESKVKTA
jgi:hypothetical protein